VREPGTKPKRILIADDNPINRQAICRIISDDRRLSPYFEAENGLDAVNIALCAQPDLVVMDFSMPVMNGLDASKRIKGIWPDVSIVLVSVYMEQLTDKEMAECGITAQLSKERAGTDLVPTVCRLLGLSCSTGD
jgi:CheY-like chemotaxis protein